MNTKVLDKIVIIEYPEGCGFNACTVFSKESGLMDYWHSRHPFNRSEMQKIYERFADHVKIEQYMQGSEPFRKGAS